MYAANNSRYFFFIMNVYSTSNIDTHVASKSFFQTQFIKILSLYNVILQKLI